MQKKIIALLLVFVLFVPTFQATAAGTPRLTYITQVGTFLTVSGTTATYDLEVWAITSVTNISATLQLQKAAGSGWTNYGASWTVSNSSDDLYASGTKTVESGGTYRLKAVITAYVGTSSASTTSYSA